MDVSRCSVRAEWTFEIEGRVHGPFENTVVDTSWIAQGIENMPSPHLVAGKDTEIGNTIAEFFRKPVTAVIRSGNVVRFRTQLLSSECNGDFNKFSIFRGGTEVPGTGLMFNLLRKPWSKAEGTIVTVESRITVTEV